MGTKIAIVTGGSRGIGAATAEQLAEDGYDVCISYHTNEQAAIDVVTGVKALGRKAIHVQCDVGIEQDVLNLFDACYTGLGTPDALVNNAGIVAEKSRVDQMELSRFEKMFTTNVTGTFLACREAIKRMSTLRGGSGGVIVNVSSIAARIASPGEYVDYAASKAAVDTLTRGLAIEVADESIRVNAVRPGIIDTEIHASGGQPDRVKQFSPLIPMKRGGTPIEVAQTIRWLLSDEASYITGALIDVSGGR
jgi:NAD(P)-dependent dehydrogenase (short-subunit alcohol dehydrogenase family)